MCIDTLLNLVGEKPPVKLANRKSSKVHELGSGFPAKMLQTGYDDGGGDYGAGIWKAGSLQLGRRRMAGSVALRHKKSGAGSPVAAFRGGSVLNC